ncbi:MAG TPA: allantoinase AllB, partial [Streptosporangiaceae bacterium]
MACDLVIHAPRVVCDEGEAGRGAGLPGNLEADRDIGVPEGPEAGRTIGVSAGRIVAVEPLGRRLGTAQVLELSEDVVLLPGLVDSHVHICEPGNTEWEGFATATRAAAAGGITTLVDMPVDSVPATVDVAALRAKQDAAKGQCHVDVAFWGGVVPSNAAGLARMHRAGVAGFKCFLSDSGADGFPPVDVRVMEQALRILRDLGTPLLVHAESAETGGSAVRHDPEDVSAHTTEKSSGSWSATRVGARRYADYLASRPRDLENQAVMQVIEAARVTGGWAHVVHLSSSDPLPAIASARREGVRLTVESCPHYLALTAEEVGDGQTAFKCSPPIREAANRDLLWDGLSHGIIDLIASDHSPCTPIMKALDSGDFGVAWGGISSLQLALPAVWTEAQRRGFTLRDVVAWMAGRPAQLAGLRRKGRIAPGYDADFCMFAPDKAFTVDP